MGTSAKAAQNVNELFYEIVMKLSGAEPTQAAGMAITDGSGLCLSSFLSARVIPCIGNGPILTVFEKVYIFREIENELRLSFQNEVRAKVSLEGMKEFLCKYFAPLVVECCFELFGDGGLLSWPSIFFVGGLVHVGFANIKRH